MFISSMSIIVLLNQHFQSNEREMQKKLYPPAAESKSEQSQNVIIVLRIDLTTFRLLG